MRFPMIDVLRAFAALTVVVYHVVEIFEWHSFPTSGLLSWFRAGWMGVDLFFVISGFVITLSAFSRLNDSRTSNFAVSFASARISRIAPLHYLTCLVVLVFVQPVLTLDPGIWRNILTHSFFVHNFSTTTFGELNGPNWSVAVEMQFYLLILFISPWLLRINWRLLLIGGVAGAWAWRLAAFLLIPIDGKLGTFPLFVGVAQLPGMLDEFTMGVLLARFVWSDVGRNWLTFSPEKFLGMTGLTVLLLWCVMAVYWPNAGYWDSGMMVVCFRTLLAVSWASLVMTACLLTKPIVLFLAAPLRYLGTISYGIYLWHLPVLLGFKGIAWVDGRTALPYVLALTLILASGSWHFFELPIMERAKEWLTRRSTVLSAGQSPFDKGLLAAPSRI